MPSNNFLSNGFEIIPKLFSSQQCEQLAAQISPLLQDAAGTRALLTLNGCGALVQCLREHAALSDILPADFVAVQCTYFEKSQTRNWLVSVHQDLSIPVADFVEHPELQGWSEKEGQLFVQAPRALLEKMLAIRVHLDPCLAQDGALRVIPKSHLLGRLNADEAITIRKNSQEILCAVEQGGALVMRPLLLHASSKSSGQGLRRVLHFLFAPREPAYGLRWQHAV